MSIPITDKADNVSTLVDNVNGLTETVNEQLDVSVLANLSTEAKNTLVAAINELNNLKIGKVGDIDFQGNISAYSFNSKEFNVGPDQYNNSSINFLDAKTDLEVFLRWNSELQKWQISDPEGNTYDLTGGSLDFNENTNHLIIKMLTEEQLQSYIGPKGELVINSSNFKDIRIQDGVKAGGNSVSGEGSIKIRRIS